MKRNDVLNIFKLLYISIILASTYVLQLCLGYRSEYEYNLYFSEVPKMCEHLFLATVILTCGLVLYLVADKTGGGRR